MEDSCPATPLVLTGRNSKSPLQVALSSPESEGMKSPSRDSPDSRCVICLGRLHNKSFTDSCLHQFCFQCLLQWSKVKPECPLCKQPFKSIIHNVRSNLDYDQYHIEHGEPRYVISDFMHSYNFDLIPVDRRFRYRSTMTREYFRELAESFLAHTRRLPEDTYQIPPMVPYDHPPAQNVHRSNCLHVNAGQQRRRQRGTSDFRRNIYVQDLWVQDLVDISGRYRECTPQFYRENPAQIHRIIPWLNREVNVLLSDCESHAAYVLTRIVSILTQHSIRSREFRELVQPYFGDRTDHFIHELYTFAHSVYDIAGFDQHAVYGTNPNYATEVQEIFSSNDDSDIEVLETFENKEKNSSKSTKKGLKKILLKKTGEDDLKSSEPVPGPSGVSCSSSMNPIEICESDVDDIKVLEYIKPDPEIVIISSGEDSSYSLEFNLTANEKAEIKKAKSGKIRESYTSSDECTSKEKRSEHRSKKGKCKSNGVGLKGKQKKKYVNLRRRSSSSSSNSSYSSTSTNSSNLDGCRNCSSTSSCSSSNTSSSSSQGKSYSHKNKKSRSISNFSDSSSEYKPLSKYKNKKSKVSRKKYKKKINYKTSKKLSSESRVRKPSNNLNTETQKPVKKKKVKSCVVVPKGKSRDQSPPLTSFSSHSSWESGWGKHQEHHTPIRSIPSDQVGETKPSKRRESSSEIKLIQSKRSSSSTEELSNNCKRFRDGGNSFEWSRQEKPARKHSDYESSKNVKQKAWTENVKDSYLFDLNSSGLSLSECAPASSHSPASITSLTSKYSLPAKPNSLCFSDNSN